MSISIKSNKNLGKVLPESRNLAIKNLPLPLSIAVGLFLVIVYVIPFVLRYLFPRFQYVDITIMIILLIYVLTLVVIISNNYYKKTGRPISEGLNKIQNEYELKKYGKEEVEKRRKVNSILLFVGPWFIALLGIITLIKAPDPPKWIYIFVFVGFLFPIVIKILENSKPQ